MIRQFKTMAKDTITGKWFNPRMYVFETDFDGDDFDIEGRYRYNTRIDRKGRLKAILYDGSKKIGKYKADYDILTEIDFPEDGIIKLNTENGKFSLYLEGERFAKGKIFDIDDYGSAGGGSSSDSVSAMTRW